MFILANLDHFCCSVETAAASQVIKAHPDSSLKAVPLPNLLLQHPAAIDSSSKTFILLSSASKCDPKSIQTNVNTIARVAKQERGSDVDAESRVEPPMTASEIIKHLRSCGPLIPNEQPNEDDDNNGVLKAETGALQQDGEESGLRPSPSPIGTLAGSCVESEASGCLGVLHERQPVLNDQTFGFEQRARPLIRIQNFVSKKQATPLVRDQSHIPARSHPACEGFQDTSRTPPARNRFKANSSLKFQDYLEQQVDSFLRAETERMADNTRALEDIQKRLKARAKLLPDLN